MMHRLSMVCSNIMSVFKLVCDQIGMPVSPDKSEGPMQIIEFLGLTIDTIQMVVRSLKDKMQDITLILITIIRKRKATSAELESLAGKLNFITKVVPAGRSFTKMKRSLLLYMLGRLGLRFLLDIEPDK